MEYINYKEDFPLLIRMSNVCGVQTGVPDFDFIIRLRSHLSEFRAGRKDGELYNCRVGDREDELVVILNNHGLAPCGELLCEMTYFIPDPDMPDGIRTVVRNYKTGIALVTKVADCNSDFDCDCVAEFEVLLPYIKGEPGAAFTFEDFTPEQLELLKGDKGDDGKSAYELAIESGYKGLEEEFASALSEVDDMVRQVPADIELEAIEPGIITDVLRKSEQLLTAAEQEQVRKNLNLSKEELFRDWWNKRCYFSSKVIVGGYYPEKAPDPSKPYLLNKLWFNYDEALTIAAASGPKYSMEPWLYCHTYPGTKTLLPTCNYGNKNNSNVIYYCTSIVTFRFVDGYSLAPTTQYNTAGGTYNFDGLPNLERIVDNVLDIESLTAKNCPKLRELRFKIRYNRAYSINLQNSPLWEFDCIKYSIENVTLATSVTIIVHPDVYAKLTGDESNAAFANLSSEEKEQWTSLIPIAQSKNITFVTV